MRAYLLLFALLPTLAFSAQTAEVKKYVSSAIALYENLEYEKALKQLDKARLKSGGTEDDASISLVEGIIYAEMGKEDKADTAFRTGFALDPDVKLPVEVSPKVEKVANKARDKVKKMLAPQLEKQRQEDEARKQAELERQQAEDARKKEEDHRRQEEEMKSKTNQPPPLGPVEQKLSLRKWAWAPAIVGVAGGVVGAIFLVQAKNKYEALNGLTVPAGMGLQYKNDGASAQTLGWVFMSVGIVGLAAAAAFLPFGGGEVVPSTSFFLTPNGGGAMVRWELP
jgi:tetratricopeptide (TPR) repeat protein